MISKSQEINKRLGFQKEFSEGICHDFEVTMVDINTVCMLLVVIAKVGHHGSDWRIAVMIMMVIYG